MMAGPPKDWTNKIAAGLLSGQPKPTNYFGALTPSPEQLMAQVLGKYPAIERHKGALTVRQGPAMSDGRQLEYYPPWERDNPIPGKATVELYNTKESPEIMQNLVAGDMLHYMGSVDPRNNQTIDPTFRAVKQQFLSTLTPEQVAVDRRAYENEKRFYGNNPPSFEDWMDFNRGDAYLRGYLTPDAQDNWLNVYTPDQKQLLEKLKLYLTRGSLAPGMTR